MTKHAVALALVTLASTGCDSMTYSTIECEVTIHSEYADSVTFRPPEYADACRAKWERDGPGPGTRYPL